MECLATKLCRLNQSPLENVWEGRVVLPYLYRCHSVRTSNRTLGMSTEEVAQLAEGGWRWLARLSPRPVSAVNIVLHQRQARPIPSTTSWLHWEKRTKIFKNQGCFIENIWTKQKSLGWEDRTKFGLWVFEHQIVWPTGAFNRRKQKGLSQLFDSSIYSTPKVFLKDGVK